MYNHKQIINYMYKKLFKYFFVITLFIITNCSSTLLKGNYPDWYVNQPKNTQTSLYGVGQGYNMDTAKELALKNISEQIMVTVSSKSSIYKAETKADYVEESEFNISEKTEEITFSDYEVINSFQGKKDFFVLISVNRQKLIQLQKDDLQKLDDEINTLDKNSKRRTSLERLVALKNIKKLTKRAETKAKVIKSLESTFYARDYLDKYNNYNKEYTQLLSNTKFYIKTNDSFDKQIASIFKKHLNENNIKTLNNFSTSVTILDIYSSVSTKKIYGSYNSKANIHMGLLVKGMTIKTNNILVKGSSTISKKEAKNNVVKQLDAKIKKEGLFKILRLE